MIKLFKNNLVAKVVFALNNKLCIRYLRGVNQKSTVNSSSLSPSSSLKLLQKRLKLK